MTLTFYCNFIQTQPQCSDVKWTKFHPIWMALISLPQLVWTLLTSNVQHTRHVSTMVSVCWKSMETGASSATVQLGTRDNDVTKVKVCSVKVHQAYAARKTFFFDQAGCSKFSGKWRSNNTLKCQESMLFHFKSYYKFLFLSTLSFIKDFDKKVCWCWGREACNIMTAQQERTCSFQDLQGNDIKGAILWILEIHVNSHSFAKMKQCASCTILGRHF